MSDQEENDKALATSSVSIITFDYDIFLSYSSKDESIVLELVRYLKEKGKRVWLDKKQIYSGNIRQKIQDGLDASQFLIQVISFNSLESEWVGHERDTFLIEDPRNIQGRYVPFIIGEIADIDIPSNIRASKYIDFRIEKNRNTGYEELLMACSVQNSFGKTDCIRFQGNEEKTKTNKCPFPGLKTFLVNDHDHFFGREHDIENVFEQIRIDSENPFRWLIIDGDSGVGKSSFVNAGLIPKIREISKKFSILDILRPGNDPMNHLISVLTKHFYTSEDEIKSAYKNLQEKLKTGGLRTLHDWLQCHISSGEKVILVIDQLEDIVTFKKSDWLMEFDAIVSGAIDVVGGPLHLITVVRSDYVSESLNQLPLLNSSIKSSDRYTLPQMSSDGIRSVIQESINISELECDEVLVDLIVNDAIKSGPAALALTQSLLEKLWEVANKTNSKKVTHKLYDELGGLGGTLISQADRVFKSLDQKKQDRILKFLGNLVEVRSDIVDRPHTITRELALKEANDVIGLLSGLNSPSTWENNIPPPRLVVVSKDKNNADNQTFYVNLAHEALIQWEPVSLIIAQKRDELLTIDEFKAAVKKGKKQPINKVEVEIRWTHENLFSIYKSTKHLKRYDELEKDELEFLGPMKADEIFREIDNQSTSPERRKFLGERLSIISDPRKGVTVIGGIPQIEWCDVTGDYVVIKKPWENCRPSTLRFLFSKNTYIKKIKTFEISKYLITCAQFKAFVEDKENGYCDKKNWDRFPEEFIPKDGEKPPQPQWGFYNHPVNNVSWFAAMAFCKWLNKKLKTDELNSLICLPNEWEWQLAALGAENKNCNTQNSGLNQTTAVGMFPDSKSDAGALDMLGNQWEWCLNKYDKPNNESWNVKDYESRTIRGGSWSNKKSSTNSTMRLTSQPFLFNAGIGFRVVRKKAKSC